MILLCGKKLPRTEMPRIDRHIWLRWLHVGREPTCRTLEKMDIPTVGAAGANIVKYAVGYDFEYTNGMPIRYVGFPFPVAGQPKSVHHSYVFESNDVVSGKPMMQAIVDGLTQPLTEKEKILRESRRKQRLNRDC